MGVGAGAVVALAQLKPTRDLLLKLKDPGEGPTPEQREKAWFKVKMVGEGGGKRVVAEVTGGDPGYGETSKMLAESALCLAHDELPDAPGSSPRRSRWATRSSPGCKRRGSALRSTAARFRRWPPSGLRAISPLRPVASPS